MEEIQNISFVVMDYRDSGAQVCLAGDDEGGSSRFSYEGVSNNPNARFNDVVKCFKDACVDLGKDPKECVLVLCDSMPAFSKRERDQIVKALFQDTGIYGLSIFPSELLHLFSYGTTSGVVISVIDNLIQIVPCYEGCVIQWAIVKTKKNGNTLADYFKPPVEIHKLVFSVIMSCDVTIRKRLFENITFEDENIPIREFKGRLQKEISTICKDFAVQVNISNGALLGGSIIGTIMKDQHGEQNFFCYMQRNDSYVSIHYLFFDTCWKEEVSSTRSPSTAPIPVNRNPIKPPPRPASTILIRPRCTELVQMEKVLIPGPHLLKKNVSIKPVKSSNLTSPSNPPPKVVPSPQKRFLPPVVENKSIVVPVPRGNLKKSITPAQLTTKTGSSPKQSDIIPGPHLLKTRVNTQENLRSISKTNEQEVNRLGGSSLPPNKPNTPLYGSITPVTPSFKKNTTPPSTPNFTLKPVISKEEKPNTVTPGNNMFKQNKNIPPSSVVTDTTKKTVSHWKSKNEVPSAVVEKGLQSKEVIVGKNDVSGQKSPEKKQNNFSENSDRICNDTESEAKQALAPFILLDDEEQKELPEFVDSLALGYENFDNITYMSNLPYGEEIFEKLDPSLGITLPEFLAIYYYTCEWPQKIHNTYKQLNADLTNSDRSKVSKWKYYIHYLFSGLQKIPPWVCVQDLYRGVARDLEKEHPNKYKKDNNITWFACTSTTRNFEVITSFFESNQPRTIFAINGAFSGRSLEMFSSKPSEAEILMPPGSRFRVVSVTRLQPFICMIQLRQIPTLEKLLKFE